jgi:hypothetical protein
MSRPNPPTILIPPIHHEALAVIKLSFEQVVTALAPQIVYDLATDAPTREIVLKQPGDISTRARGDLERAIDLWNVCAVLDGGDAWLICGRLIDP